MTKFRYKELNPWAWREKDDATKKDRADVGYYDIEVHLRKEAGDVMGIGMPSNLIEEERRAIYNDNILMEQLADLPEEKREQLLDFLVETFCYYRIEGELAGLMKAHAMFSEHLEMMAEMENEITPEDLKALEEAGIINESDDDNQAPPRRRNKKSWLN